MKKAPHPREIIGRKREKCKVTGKCEPVPEKGFNYWGNASHKCKHCNRYLSKAAGRM